MLSPLIAMISYCYVFHVGFMNFYLSIGLACFGLAMIWSGTARGLLGALLVSPLVVLAHPLGILWLAGVALYRFTWLRTAGLLRLSLPLAVAAGLWAVRWYLKLHPAYEADWADPPFYQWNGPDQFRIFGIDYEYLSWAVVLLGSASLPSNSGDTKETPASGKIDDYWSSYTLSPFVLWFSCPRTFGLNRAEAGLAAWRPD